LVKTQKFNTLNHYGGSDGHTYTYIRTPYYATSNGYSYGPYQVTQGYSSHNSYPKKQITQYQYSNPSHQYQNNFRNHYKPKPKQPDNLTAIKSKSYATSKPIVQNYQTFAFVKTPQSALGIPRWTYGYRPIMQFKTVGETPVKGFVLKPVRDKLPLKQF
jgi:hypothetical protein